jgi:glycosyltransferase involved in cell wall biosynthesis
MRIVIDATNLRDGGGVTHLTQILNEIDESKITFESIIILGCKKTLALIHDKSYIKKINKKVFEKNYLIRIIWLFTRLNYFLRQEEADILFAPGGVFFNSFRPVVTMSRNSLPMELNEARRYGMSLTYIRLLFLRYMQRQSFLKADGFIFLTEYAKNDFIKQGWLNLEMQRPRISIIPHGVAPILVSGKNGIIHKTNFNIENPFRIVYISIIDLYKHQDKVALAIEKLNNDGYFVEVNFVGPYYRPAFKRFNNVVNGMSDKVKLRIKYHGRLNRSEQSILYNKMDCFLFASTCENMPNILLEGMSSGLPIVCSSRGPMPEILKTAGEYFNPESVQSICAAIIKLYNSFELRNKLSNESIQLSKNYSWAKCSNDTFQFLTQFKK